MSKEFPRGEVIDRAERLILRIRDIQSCRITTDETGSITEVHVVATTDRAPKMVARDVETCLKAELGLEVDYRKIGVVLMEPAVRSFPGVIDGPYIDRSGDGSAEDLDRMVEERFSEPAEERKTAMEKTPGEDKSFELQFLEADTRVRFRGLSVSVDEGRVDVEVRLFRNGLEVTGCLGSLRKAGPAYETIAGATLHALTELLDERFDLCLSGVEEIELSGRRAIVTAVELVEGRTARSFSGCAFVGRDPNEASVLAVLDAVNRPLGRWKSRKEINYRIS